MAFVTSPALHKPCMTQTGAAGVQTDNRKQWTYNPRKAVIAGSTNKYEHISTLRIG